MGTLVYGTLFPGLGPLFLGNLTGPSTFPGWSAWSSTVSVVLFWLKGLVNLLFLHPGFRPFWAGGLAGLGGMPMPSTPLSDRALTAPNPTKKSDKEKSKNDTTRMTRCYQLLQPDEY